MKNTRVLKTDFIRSISKVTGFRQSDIEEVIAAMTNVISEYLEEGCSVCIRNLGTFSTRMSKDRVIKNYITGSKYFSEAHPVPRFAYADTLYNRVAYKFKTKDEVVKVLDEDI